MSESPRANPFVTTRAVDCERTFLGRDAILDLVERQLRSPRQSAIVLTGPRRIGKTSILLHLQRFLPSPSFLPVYFDLMGGGGSPLPRLLFELAQAMAREARLAPPRPEDFADDGHFEARFLPALYEALGEECRPVLLLDQLDMLDAGDAPPAQSSAHAFLACLRGLLQRQSWLGVVFVVEGTMEALPREMQAVLKGARCERVSMLDAGAARALVALVRGEGGLMVGPAAEEHILALTSCHPYFLQLLCQMLWERAFTSGAREVDVRAVDDAATEALAAGTSGFSWIWNGFLPAERVVLSAVAQATSRKPAVSKSKLAGLFERHEVSLADGKLLQAPDVLVESEVLREAQGGYLFSVELLRRWVVSRKPLARVKDELAPDVPLACTLYRSARGLYRRRRIGPVPELLRQALRLDPTLVDARLLLGQVLLDQGQMAQGVRELEEAYRRAREVARPVLIRALLAYGEAREQAGDDEQALAAYQRLLEICPEEAPARQRSAAIWLRRGDQALHAGELDLAYRAYIEAGAVEKAAAILPLQKQRVRDAALRRAEELEQQKEWAAAAEQYRWLMTEEPDQPRWPEALARVQAEHEISQRYDDARRALDWGDPQEALRTLAVVVGLRPDYRDASELLAGVLHPPAPGRRSLLRRSFPWVAAAALGLCAGIAFTLQAHKGAPPPRSLPAPPRAALFEPERQDLKGLLAADTALLQRRFSEGRTQIDRLLARKDLAPGVRQLALDRRQLAEHETRAQAAVEGFLHAAGGKEVDQALRLYREIPPGSPYQHGVREVYGRLVQQAIANHLQRAQAARTRGRCPDARAHLEQVLSLQPDHPAARAALQRPCPEGTPVANAAKSGAPPDATSPAAEEP